MPNTLEVQSAHVRFNQGTPNEVYALRGASLDLAAGTFVTIVGSNGAGKSTLTNVIAGSVMPSAGTVRIHGKDVTRLPDYRRSRWVARVFADPLAGTVPDMTIEDNLSLAMARGRRRTLHAANSRRKRASTMEALSVLGLELEHRLDENVGRLSSGQRQSLTLAMACATTPDILILDEHLSALDPITRERLTDLTVRVARTAGCVTVMVTHSMEDAVRLGDQLLVMHEGQIVASFTGDEKSALSVASLLEKIQLAGAHLGDRSLLDVSNKGKM